jgi:hypothetical protein
VFRHVNFIFSFFNVYAVILKLIDQPVCNLAKKMFLHIEYLETGSKAKK